MLIDIRIVFTQTLADATEPVEKFRPVSFQLFGPRPGFFVALAERLFATDRAALGFDFGRPIRFDGRIPGGRLVLFVATQ